MTRAIEDLEESGEHPRLELVRPAADASNARDLVRALKAGEPWAPAALFNRHAPDVQRVLVRVLGIDPELQDLIQDVFLAALEGIGRLDDPDRLRSWLVGICVHIARHRIRSRRRRWWMILVPHDKLPQPIAEPVDASERETVRATYRVLDQLHPDDRIVLALRLLEGMDVMDVAEAAGVSRATIKRRIARAQARFRFLAAAEPALQEWAEAGDT